MEKNEKRMKRKNLLIYPALTLYTANGPGPSGTHGSEACAARAGRAAISGV
jgi:hypothetical protein